MPAKTSHSSDVLKFWRAIETFNMPDLPSAASLGNRRRKDLMPGDLLPWNTMDFLFPENGKRWRHTLYFYPIAKETIMQLLEKSVPHQLSDYREPMPGYTCLAAIAIDQQGQAIERSYVRSSFPYGIKILKEKRKPDELTELLQQAYTEYGERFNLPKTKPEATPKDENQPQPLANPTGLTWTELQKELDDLQKLVAGRLSPTIPIVCISEEVYEKAASEPPFMNSFYLNDLDELINQSDEPGRPLEQYLTRQVNIAARVDLLTPHALFTYINPTELTTGRWPSPTQHGLYSAQLAALHLSLSQLRHQSGLRGINGPPGTGKTTLLREIIVDVVVNRAKRLASADPAKLFDVQSKEIAQYCKYYTYNNKVLSNDGILVSSNNNAAVENLSRELPSLKSIDFEAFQDADYFSDIAANLLQEGECWAMISAILGNAGNRNAFNSRFWFDREKGFHHLLSVNKDQKKVKEYTELFAATAEELQSLLQEFDQFQSIAVNHYTLLSEWFQKGKPESSLPSKWKGLHTRLTKEYEIAAHNLPDPGFLQRSMEDIHKMTPYSSTRINHLRSLIFIKSLQLHQYAILANARYFQTNLGAFVDMLAGKHAENMTSDVREVLWGSFFFCIPMVSATLASVEKLFTNMGKGSLGWLLLDEAGQASPSSACGALWRAQRAILIGDTLQIPPVITIPEGLADFLKNQYQLEDNCWSPLRSAAQTLADRVTPVGANITISDSIVWTGIPLRAHRRCQNPMFHIANTIAYNEQMVKLTGHSQKTARVPASCWIDVKSISLINRHTVKEEVTALQEMLAIVRASGYPDDIFIISPFRAIGDYCREKIASIKNSRVKSGTVHTFQGKEADIVFLILGTDRTNHGARKWASSTPNMLNVAVTRAKDRLYVIGDKQLWGACQYFNHLAESLPEKTYQTGSLFQYF